MSIRCSHIIKALTAVFAVSALIVSAGCGMSSEPQTQPQPQTPTQEEPTGPIDVVSSINQWGSLAKQIGGDDVNVTSILDSTNVDAHDFEPKTADVAKIAKAQIVVLNGAGYDSWASKSLSKQTVSVSAAQIVGAMEGDNPHLWFSKDARSGMAKELVDAFSKALPSKKDDFTKRYEQWQKAETKVEQVMDDFSQSHKDVTYAATESVAYYLMSDMGFTDKTPKGYATSSAAEGEAAPADLQEFQKLIEDRDIDLLVNNTQEASDATNMITGTAGRSDVPVFDVSEQMPQDKANLTDWIASLVDTVTGYFDTCDNSDDSNDSDDSEANDTSDNASNDSSTDKSSKTTSCTPSSSSTDADNNSNSNTTDSNSGQSDPGK